MTEFKKVTSTSNENYAFFQVIGELSRKEGKFGVEVNVNIDNVYSIFASEKDFKIGKQDPNARYLSLPRTYAKDTVESVNGVYQPKVNKYGDQMVKGGVKHYGIYNKDTKTIYAVTADEIKGLADAYQTNHKALEAAKNTSAAKVISQDETDDIFGGSK